MNIDLGALNFLRKKEKPVEDEPRSVYIADHGTSAYHQMFNKSKRWTVVTSLDDADMVQFVGGADVNPVIYGQTMHPETRIDTNRDKRDAMLFKFCVSQNIPMAGICRGAQFLNVMCGGELYQHVDNHRGPHDCFDTQGRTWRTTSTHHQMMVPTDEGLVLAWARESTSRALMKEGKSITYIRSDNEDDPEVVYYWYHDVLCFQGHPEFPGMPDLAAIYLSYLDDYLFGEL